jgi:hypothetical protein
MFVYSETDVRRNHIDNTFFQTKLVTDIKRSVWKDDHKVSVVESVLLTGHPNSQNIDKRWYRWYTVASFGFRRNKFDNIIIYNCRRQANGRRGNPYLHNNMNVPMDFLQDGEGALADEFRDAMWETFRITKQEDFYPIMKEYDLYTHKLIPTNLRTAFKADNFGTYVETAFGKRRRPMLTIAARQTEPYVVSLAREFRGLVPDAELQAFVESTHFDDELEEQFKPHTPMVRKYIRSLSPAARSKLLASGLDFLDTQRIKTLSGDSRGGGWAKGLPPDSQFTSWSAILRDIRGDYWDRVEVLSDV